MCQRLGRRSRRLLLVEDNTDLREALAMALKTKGYAVDCAGSGTQAMALMRRSHEPPDVVITDLQMPGGDGWSLRQNMLADDALASVPVVVISAGTSRPNKESLRALAYLEKPFTLNSLLEVIEGSAHPKAN